MRSPPVWRILSVVALLGGCGGGGASPTSPGATGRPEGPAPVSPEWTSATKDAAGPGAECDAAKAAILAESACKGALCAHGASLAKAWTARCGAGSKELAAAAVELGAQAKKAPSACASKLEDVLQHGCGKDLTCEQTAARWAAKCGKSEGSPLVLGMLARVVEHKSALPSVTLDLRGCEELRAEMARGATCTPATCAAAPGAVRAYHARCEGEGELPTAATAVLETAILAAARQQPVPTIVRKESAKLAKGDMPVLLADGWGAVASVCDARPADLAAYVDARAACESGKIVLVRVFATVAADVDVRAGLLDAPDDDTFARRFPSLRAAGEADARAARATKRLEAELPKIALLTRDTARASEAARALVGVVGEHAFALSRSPQAQAALGAADDALAPALAELGRMKLEAAKDKGLSAMDLAGLAGRAELRPFADVGEDGAVSIGARTPARRVRGATYLPHAMAAYTAALGELATLAKKKRPSAKDARDAKARGLEAVKTCSGAERLADESERALIACAFAVNPCDPAKLTALATDLDKARDDTDAARHTLDLVGSADTKRGHEELDAAAVKGGCLEPKW